MGQALSETVNLAPLFACRGAVTDAKNSARSIRFGNVVTAACVAAGSGWKPLLPEPCFRSGILILQSERAAARDTAPAAFREAFYARGVALTAYEDGLVRLSMPQAALHEGELQRLRDALLLAN